MPQRPLRNALVRKFYADSNRVGEILPPYFIYAYVITTVALPVVDPLGANV
jgi:hypothetical protein